MVEESGTLESQLEATKVKTTVIIVDMIQKSVEPSWSPLESGVCVCTCVA